MKETTQQLTRRAMLKGVTLAAAGIIGAPMINRRRFALFGSARGTYSTRTIDLIKQSTVIDMLGPMTLDFDKQAKWFADPESFTTTDLQPYKESGINIFHPAIGLG